MPAFTFQKECSIHLDKHACRVCGSLVGRIMPQIRWLLVVIRTVEIFPGFAPCRIGNCSHGTELLGEAFTFLFLFFHSVHSASVRRPLRLPSLFRITAPLALYAFVIGIGRLELTVEKTTSQYKSLLKQKWCTMQARALMP